MRIPFLQKYIVSEETQAAILKNCHLVVDGLNFFYDSYENAGLHSILGVEANAYAKYLTEKLKIFKKANIKCYFVFATANPIFFNQRINTLKYDREWTPRYTPCIFLRDICFQVLEEAGIHFATSVRTGKEDCLALARRLNCPILSNSPTLCFNKVPYIPIITLNTSSKNHISCRQYNFKCFLTKHNLTEKKAAIFAVLTDIELFPLEFFDDMFKTLCIYHTVLIVKYKYIIEWLSEHTHEEIINYISDFLTSKININKFIEYVDNFLENMQHDRDSVVTDYLYEDLKLTVFYQDPLWFEKGVATGKIAKRYIDLYKIKFLEGSYSLECIDNNNQTDSVMLSIDIIKYAFNLLTNFQKNRSFTVLQQGGNPVEIYADDLNIRKPKYECDVSVFENGWADIKRLELFEHFLNENDINIAKVNKVPRDVRMLLIALTYFTRRKLSEDINVTKEVYSCIVSCVLLQHSKSQAGLEKYFKCDVDEAKKIFNAGSVIPLQDFYWCLLHMNYLNTLCGGPYKTTKYHKTLNGKFIYMLLCDMSSSDRKPKEFIQDLFKTNPRVLKYINLLINMYEGLLKK